MYSVHVNHVVLLGVTLESNLGWSIHINNIVSQAMQRFYLLRQLKFMSMSGDALDNVFASLVLISAASIMLFLFLPIIFLKMILTKLTLY